MIDQDLHAAAFPRLDKAQLAALEGCPLSKLKHYRAGEKLFEAGQRDANSYVVLTEAMNSHDVGRGRGGLEAALARFEEGRLIKEYNVV